MAVKAGRKGVGRAAGEGASLTVTLRVMLDALFRPTRSLASASCAESPLRRAGAGGEEVRVLFRRCLPMAGPALLFRVKREGFSGCRAEAVPGGVLLTCRR